MLITELDIKIIENEVAKNTVKKSSQSKDNSFISNQIQDGNKTHELDESNIETGEIDIKDLSKRPGSQHNSKKGNILHNKKQSNILNKTITESEQKRMVLTQNLSHDQQTPISNLAALNIKANKSGSVATGHNK